MEGVRSASAVRRWIGELLDDRSGPSVRHDERQSVFMLRTDVNEMNVNSVDLGHEHGQRVESRLHLPPVVIGTPVADDFLELAELITLRAIRDGLLVRP